MTAAVYDNDIDKFIQDQKSKLANERQRLNDGGENKRRTWDRTGRNDYTLAEQTQRRPISGGRTGLPIGGDGAEVKKRQMQAERNREYNEMIQKKPPPRRRFPVTPPTPMTRQRAQDTDAEDPAPAPAPAHEGASPRLSEKREPPPQQDLSPRRKPLTPVDSMGLPVGQYESTKRKLQHDIQRQYREMLTQQKEENDRLTLLQLGLAGKVALPSDLPDQKENVCPESVIWPEYEPTDHIDHSMQCEDYNHGIQKAKARQLEALEDIGRRGEQLRRKLDEETIRESDQENTLREEVWRQHQGNPPENTKEFRPAYFKIGDYEKYRQALNDQRREEYNELLAKLKDVKARQRYFKTEAQHEPTVHNRHLWREQSEELGLPIGEHEKKKKELADERRRDMQANLSKQKQQQQQQQPSSRRQWQDTDQSGLKFATQDQTAKFNEEKRREYNEAISKKPYPNRQWREPSAGGGVLFVGEMEKKQIAKQKLAEEKRRAYLKKTMETSNRLWREPSSEEGLKVGENEERKKALAAERRRDFERSMAGKRDDGPRTWREPSFERGLPLGQYEATKLKYQAERNRDYNDLLDRQPPLSDRRVWREPSDSSMGLDFNKYKWKNKYLRKNDEIENVKTQNMKSSSPQGSQTWRGPTSVPPLYFGSREEEVERLAQTEREYFNLLAKLGPKDPRSDLPPKPATPGGFLNRLGRDEQRRQQLSEERRQEYNKLLAEKQQRVGRRAEGEYNATIPGLRGADSAKYYYPERPKSDSDVRGSWSKPWFERNRSYVDFKPFSLEKMKQRNEEYNQFLREKEGQKRPRGQVKHGYHKKPPYWTEPESAIVTALGEQKQGDTYATLPGLRYEDSTRAKYNELERNKEYNDFLRHKAYLEQISRNQGPEGPPGAPRKGWATPTYEEMLDKKRQEEARYRRFDDPEYSRPGMKSYGSEGALNGIDGERRGTGLDTDLDKQLRISDRHRSILDDPLWLSPRRGENYDREAPISRLRDYNFKEAELSSRPTSPKQQAEVGDRKRYQDAAPPRDQGPPPSNTEAGYYATLPVGEQQEKRSLPKDDGVEERMSAQQRKKEQYRKELQQQMLEASEAKRKEKLDGMKVSATGVTDPEKRQDRLRGLGASSVPPPPPPQPAPVVLAQPVYKIADPAPVLSTRVVDYDKLSPRSELVLGRKSLFTGHNQWEQIQQLDKINFDLDRKRYTAPATNSSSGILDKGFDMLLEPPRVSSIKVRPELEYHPSTFVTGGGGGSFSSLDETYHYLATKNPLDPEVVGAAHPGVTAVAIPQAAAATGANTANTARVRFDDGQRQAPGGGATLAAEGNDAKAVARAKAQQYQLELAKQIEEDKLKKAKQKAQQEWYDMKLEEEAKAYNPYGKGGGGAPMKDERGNIIADLRALRRPGGPPTTAGVYAGTSPRPPSPRDDLIRTPPLQTTAAGEPSHARGGHGIFGQPKTDAEKHQTDVYKDDLRRQIEAKKAAAALEREKERYEEEKEQRRIEAERKRMQEEYEEERRKIKLKEDEARRKNEELMRQAEERKREAEQRRLDAENERRRQQEEADRERLEREAAERGKSPPLPAVGRKQATENTPEPADKALTYRASSPPVPAARTSLAAENRPHSIAKQQNEEAETRYVPSALSNRIDAPSLDRGRSPVDRAPSSSRAPSADILNALARMKHQLASERDRVETMLDKNENEPEVFDPRLAQRPPPAPRVQRDIDVFEMARNRNTVPVRRAPTADNKPNPEHLREFHSLKQADTDSRQEFQRHYPYDPMSNEHLEQQQAALIRQQEQTLRELRGKSKFEKALPNMEPKDLGLNRHRTISPQPMLQSNSAFIDMNGLGPVFPDDLDDLPRRNESARQRRREGLFTSPRPGSVTSLDVDQIARKNEQRLKKLRDIQGDDLSLNDPDDVLDRFMSKQAHNRDFVTELDSESDTFTPYKSDYAG
ncbi:centrosome and spindle pole-associated protein 1-like [Haliotis asinina]|uniref:centrosome and spindle pole-associated protein 1-like n=1 Tax=Haliotis asinina TaxID=109174 RepID=UPI0035326082